MASVLSSTPHLAGVHRLPWEGPQPRFTLNLTFLVTPAKGVVGPAHTPATPETFPQAPFPQRLAWANHSFTRSLTHLFNSFALSTVARGQRRREPPAKSESGEQGAGPPGPGES